MGIVVSQIPVKLIVEEDLTSAFIEFVMKGTLQMKIRAHVPPKGFSPQQLWDLMTSKSDLVNSGILWYHHSDGAMLRHSFLKVQSIEFRGEKIASPDTELKAKTGDYLFFYAKHK